ncbi:MAG: 4Fe-4S dicluster domain-containing protein [Pirellulales bacterium]|nr:4Fe-4S dicluster domain-containing protein [Pirellulales bacterium]
MSGTTQEHRPANSGSRRRVKLTRRLRTVVRCCIFAAAVALLLPLLPWPWSTMVVPACSSFVMLATVIATRSLGAAAMVGLPILLIVIVRRRWFCRWMCPVGLMTEAAGRVSPLSHKRCRHVPPLGKAVVLMSIIAACFGYPLLLWLDPLAIFSGLFGWGHDATAGAAKISATIFTGIMVLSILVPGAWCLKLCPLGATQEFISRPLRMLSRRWKAMRNPGDSKIIVHAESQTSAQIPRRSILTMIAGSACAGLGGTLGWEGRLAAENQNASALRPPGAVPSWQFPQLCLRCGNCARACPSEIIRTDRQPGNLLEWLTPVVVFETDYCREDCIDCMRVCPSGAIVQSDIAEKQAAVIGLAHINMDRCIMYMGPECRTMCMNSCPYEAIQMHEWTFEDDRRYPIIEAEKCPGCGACVLACTPMNAIEVRPLIHDKASDTQKPSSQE